MLNSSDDFPCDFPIKIISADPDVENLATEVVRRHCPHMEYFPVRVNKSKTQKFISVTITIKALSREQLDEIYRDLTNQPWVVMAL